MVGRNATELSIPNPAKRPSSAGVPLRDFDGAQYWVKGGLSRGCGWQYDQEG